MSDTSKTIIRDANDRFRRGEGDIPGERIMTSGLAAVIEDAGRAPLDVLGIVMRFETFTEDNDPYGTHEFGSDLHPFTKIVGPIIDSYNVEYAQGKCRKALQKVCLHELPVKVCGCGQ